MTSIRRSALLVALLIATLVLAAAACNDGGDGADGGSPTATEAAGGTATSDDEPDVPEGATPPGGDEMSLASSAFGDGAAIPVKYTCDGDNISPPLAISGVPEIAESLVLSMHDPDAPIEGGFTHWVVWNIDPSTTEVPEGTVPSGGIEGLIGTGQSGYTGPCPPSGTHGYEFTLYALDDTLDLDPAADGKAELEAAISGHELAAAQLVGTYGR